MVEGLDLGLLTFIGVDVSALPSRNVWVAPSEFVEAGTNAVEGGAGSAAVIGAAGSIEVDEVFPVTPQ